MPAKRKQPHALEAAVVGTSGGRANLNETWEDWAAPNAPRVPIEWGLTRPELAGLLTRLLGADVSPNMLRRWQDIGALPRAVVARRDRDDAPQAIYPRWAPSVIHALYLFRQAGISWEEIVPKLRSIASVQSAISQSTAAMHTGIDGHPIPEGFDEKLLSYARRQSRVTGVRITRVEVRLLDADGKQRGKHIIDIPDAEPFDRDDSAKTMELVDENGVRR
ncbi:MAG: hypothetical protein ACR2OO_03370 [Thermomicrobiales bacterium]